MSANRIRCLVKLIQDSASAHAKGITATAVAWEGVVRFSAGGMSGFDRHSARAQALGHRSALSPVHGVRIATPEGDYLAVPCAPSGWALAAIGEGEWPGEEGVDMALRQSGGRWVGRRADVRGTDGVLPAILAELRLQRYHEALSAA